MPKKIECPACSGTEYRVEDSSQEYRILVCKGCRLSFSDPMIAGNTNYYKDHLVYKSTDEEIVLKYRQSVMNRNNRRLLAMIPPGCSILDIGCGVGALVHFALNRGYDAYGIDFNEEQVYAGRKYLKLGERLIVAEFEELAMYFDSKKKFKLITLFEVIEHMANPRKIIRLLYELLDEKGLIAVSCPNEARWQPAGRIFVDYPPHHLTRWRPDTLVKFLEVEGFKHLSTQIDSRISDIFWVAYINYSAKNRLSKKNTPGRLANRVHLGDGRKVKSLIFTLLKNAFVLFDPILSIANIGTMGMRIIARKI